MITYDAVGRTLLRTGRAVVYAAPHGGDIWL